MPVLCLNFEESTQEQNNFEKNTNVERMAEVFYRYSPKIAVRKNEALFVDLDEAKKKFSFESWPQRVRFILSKFNLKASWSIAQDAPTAFAMAKVGVYDKKNLPIETLAYFSDPFVSNYKTAHELKELILKLKDQGVHFIRQFISMPSAMLVSQFGQKSLRLKSNVEDASFVQWPRYRPDDFVPEAVKLKSPKNIQATEEILFELKLALERTLLRLNSRKEIPEKMLFLFRTNQEQEVCLKIRGESIDLLNSSKSQDVKMNLKKFLRQVCTHLDREFSIEPLIGQLHQIDVHVLKTYSPVAAACATPEAEVSEKMFLFEVPTPLRPRDAHI